MKHANSALCTNPADALLPVNIHFFDQVIG